MHVTHDEVQLRLRVRQMRWEAEGVVSVCLETLDATALPSWTAGAHVDLHLPGVITRQYSLCGSLADPGQWHIAVLREPNGRGGSAAVHDSLRPGDIVDVVGPRNNFTLEEATSYLFIAGGIGITPILPMIETAVSAQATWRLAYGGRARRSMAFVDALLATYPDQVSVVPQEEVGLLDLDSLLGVPQADTLVYCCGPEPLLAAVESRCTTWKPGTLHVERFAAKPRLPAKEASELSFEVVLQQSDQTLTVPPGMSILAALEANGVDAPNSCREGICGTCETSVIEGIPDHRDSLLSEDEQAANDTMMICVGRSLSPRLVLDL